MIILSAASLKPQQAWESPGDLLITQTLGLSPRDYESWGLGWGSGVTPCE